MTAGSGSRSAPGVSEPWTPVVVERAGGGLARFDGGRPEDGPTGDIDGVLREALSISGVHRATAWTLEAERDPRLLGALEGTDLPPGDPGASAPDATLLPPPVGRQLRKLLDRLGLLSVEDVQREPRPEGPLGSWVETRSTRAMLAAPMGAGTMKAGGRDDGEDEVAGVLLLEGMGEPRRWSSEDRDRVRELAAGLTPFLQDLLPEPGPSPSLSVEEEEEDEGPPLEPSAVARPRTGLESTVRRLAPMEGAGILGLELARELRGLAESQDGFLALLEEVLEAGGGESALARDAREAGQRGLERISRFLDWTERGAAAHRPLDLNSLMAELAVRLGKITGDAVPLLLSPSARPVEVRGMASELARAVEHLVRNAREASRPGDRVRLAVRTHRDGSGEREWGRVEVADSGTGIDGEILPWVFEPFVTGWGRGSERGLGLPACRAIVEGHGGRIELRSRPGKGTVAIMDLPIPDPSEGSGEGEAEGGASPGSGTEGLRPLVVVVEDDPFLSRLLDRSLERGGFRVQRVEHVDAAQRLLERSDLPVRLLAVERTGPAGEAGAEFIRRVREDRPDCPAVLLDRRLRGADQEARDALRQADGLPADVPILAPPFDPADVLALARRLVTPASDPDTSVH